MDSHNLQVPKSTSLRIQRARRICDEEWESWRESLVQLYLDEDRSRKEIVDAMAAGHHFPINEKQLKRRFQKWGVRKYIRDRDMAIMLSFQEQHRQAGYQVTFHYKGHEVKQERLERASRRRKGVLPSITVLPSYIKAHVSSHQSLSGRLDGVSKFVTSLGSGEGPQFEQRDPQFKQHNPLLADPRNDIQESMFLTDAGDGFDLTEGVAEIPHHDTAQVSHYSNGIIMTDVPGSTLRSSSLIKSVDSRTIPSPKPNPANTTIEQQPSSVSHSVLQSADFSNYWPPEIDWSSFFNVASNKVPSVDLELYDVDIKTTQSLDMQFRPSSMGNSLSPQAVTDNNVVGRQELSLKQMSSGETPLSRIMCRSEDIPATMLPLQLLHSHFLAILDQLTVHRFKSWDSARQELIDSIQSSWLQSELDDLLCRSYENAAKAIRNRRGAKDEVDIGVHGSAALGSTIEKSKLNKRALQRFQREDSVPRTRTKLRNQLLNVNSTGALKIHLRTIREVPSTNNGTVMPCVLRISFMPAATLRTTGIAATSTRALNEIFEPQISPQIVTFNVVPPDSAILRFVSRNDLRGVQKLFETGEASPLDVDPFGFSLLSYAINAPGPEVFLLLLQGGANTQNCDHYGSTLDIIWTIWFQHVNYISHSTSRSGFRPVIGDFDQCVRMTDVALGRDYDIDDSICYNSDRASVLFEMNDCLSLEDPFSQAPERALNFLINKGYNIEKQNKKGLTPFLHAARSFRPQSLKCLKTFMRRGANIHATSTKGRGALHIALAGPYRLYGWREDNINDRYWTLKTVYQTDTLLEDYNDENWDVASTPKTQDTAIFEISSGLGDGLAWLATDEDLERDPIWGKHPVERTIYQYNCEGTEFAGLTPEYVVCKDYDGFEHWILHPTKVLKTRLRYLLLTLLRNGCDPNVLDDENASPSDYARRNEVWSHWSWALESSGYAYQARTDRWLKSSVI